MRRKAARGRREGKPVSVRAELTDAAILRSILAWRGTLPIAS